MESIIFLINIKFKFRNININYISLMNYIKMNLFQIIIYIFLRVKFLKLFNLLLI
jgi:hypothetical protein